MDQAHGGSAARAAIWRWTLATVGGVLVFVPVATAVEIYYFWTRVAPHNEDIDLAFDPFLFWLAQFASVIGAVVLAVAVTHARRAGAVDADGTLGLRCVLGLFLVWFVSMIAPLALGDPSVMGVAAQAVYALRVGLSLVGLSLVMDVLVWVIVGVILSSRPISASPTGRPAGVFAARPSPPSRGAGLTS